MVEAGIETHSVLSSLWALMIAAIICSCPFGTGIELTAWKISESQNQEVKAPGTRHQARISNSGKDEGSFGARIRRAQEQVASVKYYCTKKSAVKSSQS